jgi:hypothetical protein
MLMAPSSNAQMASAAASRQFFAPNAFSKLAVRKRCLSKKNSIKKLLLSEIFTSAKCFLLYVC